MFLLERVSIHEPNMNLIFIGPCIVIYSYNKSQRDTLFLKFILVKNASCFGQDLLSIIKSLNTVYTSISNCMTNTCLCVYGVETPADGQ